MVRPSSGKSSQWANLLVKGVLVVILLYLLGTVVGYLSQPDANTGGLSLISGLIFILYASPILIIALVGKYITDSKRQPTRSTTEVSRARKIIDTVKLIALLVLAAFLGLLLLKQLL